MIPSYVAGAFFQVGRRLRPNHKACSFRSAFGRQRAARFAVIWEYGLSAIPVIAGASGENRFDA
jgi:hypothetical protein